MKSPFGKLITLCRKGFKKLIFLVRERLDLIEVKILLLGLFLGGLLGCYLGYLFFTDIKYYQTLSSATILNIFGGRSLGIAVCLSANISPVLTISFNLFVEAMVVFITYGVFVLIMRDIIQPKLFKSAVRQAELAAQKQKTRIKKYGAIGLYLFVMFPFFMTGPVIGAIIGYLLNYRAIVNFIIVLSGTLTSIMIYTFLGNGAIHYIDQFINVDLVKKWTGILSLVLILVFLIYHMKTVKNYLNSLSDDDDDDS